MILDLHYPKMREISSVVIFSVMVFQSLGCDYYCCFDSFTEELRQEWKECCSPEECEPFKKLEPNSWEHMNYLSRSEKLPVPCNYACCLTPTVGAILGSSGLKCCNDAHCQFWKTLPPFASSSLSLRSMEESQRLTKLAEDERIAAKERESYSNTNHGSSSNYRSSDESDSDGDRSHDSNGRGNRSDVFIIWMILSGVVAIFLLVLGCFVVNKRNRMSAASRQPGIIITGTYQPQTGYGGNTHAHLPVPTMATAPHVYNYRDADLPPSYEEVHTPLTGRR